MIDSAMEIWTALKDTIRGANLLKYRGYLLGRLGRFAEAKADIDSAIYLFRKKEYEMGVMVSEFDLSKMYESQFKLDSALKYATLTFSYWKVKRDTSRIIVSVNQLINLYLKMKQFEAALDIQRESTQLLEKRDLHPLQLMDFYFLSIQLFKKANYLKKVRHYQQIFDEQEKHLKAENKMPELGYSVYK